jgi:hypothetical protein
MKSRRHRSPRPDTMKCIRLSDGGSRVVRVSNNAADELVSANCASYVPKHYWKRLGQNE